ncbi:MAG: tRNA (adenosine(37)-N6)-threonylcarbamoyltransferase complex ATPase subunit type 1 TsaE [Deltaproteobacteria bacterium]|nr:tRNA (adenosine(37)-N6)-threonylcarbamoyltransferase complex ATPase subunit type 1 TsaE [Deltaproteobacteria bacterium]
MQEAARYKTASPEETERLGEELALSLKEGDLVALTGELGGGKTRFVRGIAKGLGSRGFVKSPSFTIINIYEGGRLPLYHIDLYRIGMAGELHSAGLEEYIYGKGVAAIEWADKAPEILDECRITVSFSYAGEFEREIEIRFKGAGKV